ncbi:MAG: hypothetical protein KGY80_13580 [Candidatus Thorarchaeota archaeon]|nr:hypothetical protein [Candidatus Thorarchaeota archaeon]
MRRREHLLLAAFLVMTLVTPILAGSSDSMPTLVEQQAESMTMDSDAGLATIEAMVSKVDQWGGVQNILASLQNATHYGYSHVDTLESVATNQMENDDGYVALSTLNLNGLTPFPNGAIGGPTAVLQLSVKPIFEVPTNLSEASFTELSESEAIALADEFVSEYESVFGIDFEQFMLVGTEIDEAAVYDWTVEDNATEYKITYVSLMNATMGNSTMASMLERSSQLGGFMDLAGADNWPTLSSVVTEVFAPVHFLSGGSIPSFNVLNMMDHYSRPYYRADSSHSDLVETVQSAIMNQISFEEPGYVDATAGNETYSLADHVGFTGTIENKMKQDDSAYSTSVVGGAAPASLSINGVPDSWLTIDDQFKLPEDYDFDGITIPENSTISEAVKQVLTHMPRQIALEVNDGLGSIDPTMFDSYIDLLWDSTTPLPDFKQTLLNTNFSSEIGETPLKDINIDMLASIMELGGMTPEALVDRIDQSLLDENPVAAILEAFLEYFDSYNLLDFLDNDVYGEPDVLVNHLNATIDGINNFLQDFGGIDTPSEFRSKEAIAEFVEDHWDLVLQSLWNAMADDDVTAIKEAVHNILEPENLQEEITPYLMADLGNSLMTGFGFSFSVNLNESAMFPELLEFETNDVELTFDADPDDISFDGPYLVVTKGTADRTVTVNTTVDFNITVHNYGSATAYRVRVLDGMSSGLDGDREFYWGKDELAPGNTWTITYNVTVNDVGLYADMPAVCFYFNTTLDTFDPNDAENWNGASYYTMSATGYQILVEEPEGGGGWWGGGLLEGEIFGIPTLYVAAGVGGVAIIGVAILLVRRRP